MKHVLYTVLGVAVAYGAAVVLVAIVWVAL